MSSLISHGVSTTQQLILFFPSFKYIAYLNFELINQQYYLILILKSRTCNIGKLQVHNFLNPSNGIRKHIKNKTTLL